MCPSSQPRRHESMEATALAAEPCCRKTIFVAFRSAALELWGTAGLDAISDCVDVETRKETITPLILSSEWLPERFAMAWYEAAWEGPAERRAVDYNAFLDRMMDHGFGRVQKFFLGFATPELLVKKGAELWRHDHTKGECVADLTGERTATVTLREHPYVTTPLARRSIAEIYRYAISLSRVSDVTVSHSSNGTTELVCRFAWT